MELPELESDSESDSSGSDGNGEMDDSLFSTPPLSPLADEPSEISFANTVKIIDINSTVRVCPILSDAWDYSQSMWSKEALDLALGHRVNDYHMDRMQHVYHAHRLCVPLTVTIPLLEYYHQYGHPGGDKLFSIVHRRYEFEIHMSELRRYCVRVSQHCQVCQAVKPRTGYTPFGTRDFWPVPDDIFMSLSFDFFGFAEMR